VKIAISSPASSSAETDEATQYLASLKVQIAKEEAKLSSLKAQVSSESEKLANLQSEIAAAQATLANNNSSSTTVISPPTPTLVTSGNYKVTETDSDSPLSPHRVRFCQVGSW
jgi:multidrug resistance efflux pump